MNKITLLFQTKKNNILSIFFTAGYPTTDSTATILKSLEENGVDMVEIGIPYSDPLADGTTIQQSSSSAIKNGMTLDLLFTQLDELKGNIKIPLILMGYYNPVMQYGIEKFCNKAASVGISGVILPDLPIIEYTSKYQKYFEGSNLSIIYLITPQTPDERIRLIDSVSNGFIYAVSSSSTTGKSNDFDDSQIEYLKKINSLGLKNPIIVGFGIHNKTTLNTAWQYANGAIVGSAYINQLTKHNDIEVATHKLLMQLKEQI
ncbi:MAG TPA: tryptophan synthase subunit alpha [Bacteroidales bacterium]|nr:tryptophan synthase subunit alpha [Bacteroidales bacterium]